MHIRDATFVITDTETTGTAPKKDRILEIAAVKVEGGEVVDRFQQLVNPERSVPKRITQITGITTGMVFDAPTINEVVPRYRAFLADGVLTAHNLSFDLNFLNAELRRIDRPEITNDTLCTLKLARRLLPGLRSKGLSRLIQFYDLNVNGRHRALGDAEATTAILQQFFSQLDFEHGIETLDELLAFQNRRYQKVRRVPNHLRKLREKVLPELPDRPGVYFMQNSRGTNLYIGKAKRLSDRVRSYFNAIESHGARRRKLMKKVRDVTWTTTETELEALFLESRLIKEHKPSYNRAQRRYRWRPFVRLDVSESYPRLSWSSNLADDGAEYYGPLRNREQAELIVDVVGRFFRLRECDNARFRLGERCLYADIDRCVVPCEGSTVDYAAEVRRVRDFLTGQDRSVLDALEERMQQSAERLEFEQAATFRDWLEQLEQLMGRQQAIAAPVLQHNAVLILPASVPHRVQLFLIRFGRPVETFACALPPTDGDTEQLRKRFATYFTPDRERPEQFSKRDVDEIRLLAHWMHVHRDEGTHLRWDPEEPAADFATRVLRHVNEICENCV